jgi:thermitase
MTTAARWALIASVAILCGLVAGPAQAAPQPRDLLVAHTDGRLTLQRGGVGKASAAAHRPGVEFVEPNYRYYAQGTPSDTLFSQQWSLRNNAVLGAQTTWNRLTGGDVTVAVIDTGVDVTHPDLRNNIWTNPGEIPGNGVDDDHDGAIDDVHGWNFVNNSDQIADDLGHGTAVAGVIAAQGDNDRGVAGIAWHAKLMILKALDATGTGTALSVAEAVNYAVAHGAQIINLSIAGSEPSEALQATLQNASNAGVLITVAAGNQGADLDAAPEYPASYAIPRLIAVAATDPAGGLLPDSNYSPTQVSLAAPGEGIKTTLPGNRYGTASGTSFAAPAVAGTFVLLKAARPSLTADQLQTAVLGTARRTGLPVRYGSLDIAAAARRVVGNLRATAGRRR